MEEYYFQLLRWGSLRKEQIWREKKNKDIFRHAKLGLLSDFSM